MESTLDDSLALAQQRGNEPSRLGFETLRKIVAGVREARLNRPDLMVRYGCYLLQHHSKSLGHELWATYEQVYVALLQYGKAGKHAAADDTSDELRVAQEYCHILSAQFPESLRVKRLEGMLWEAKGEVDMAMGEYAEILKTDDMAVSAVKRQVALCRARGRPVEAVRRLSDYLETVCSDADAWLQLCALYLGMQMYKRAAFCVEELILINPMSYLYHLRYGEILYTVGAADKGGGTEQLRTARKYFAQALDLKPTGNLRAVYGLLLTCAALGPSTAGKSKGAKVDNAEVFGHAKGMLLGMYGKGGCAESTSMLMAVKGMVATLEA